MRRAGGFCRPPFRASRSVIGAENGARPLRGACTSPGVARRANGRGRRVFHVKHRPPLLASEQLSRAPRGTGPRTRRRRSKPPLRPRAVGTRARRIGRAAALPPAAPHAPPAPPRRPRAGARATGATPRQARARTRQPRAVTRRRSLTPWIGRPRRQRPPPSNGDDRRAPPQAPPAPMIVRLLQRHGPSACHAPSCSDDRAVRLRSCSRPPLGGRSPSATIGLRRRATVAPR